MRQIEIAGREPLTLTDLVCDLNGTLAVDGQLLDGVAERIAQIRAFLAVHLLTADTHGTLPQVESALQAACAALGQPSPNVVHIGAGAEKEQYVRSHAPDTTVAIGNGVNDERMFGAAALSIAIVGHEGAATRTVLAADIVTYTPLDALDLLLMPKRLAATLRL